MRRDDQRRPVAVYAASLRVVAMECAPGSSVPVPRERLLELLDLLEDKQEDPGAHPRWDLSVEQVAERIGRSSSTVRQMCADKEFGGPPGEGAYKHRGKEWRVPEAALVAYQQRQRDGGRSASDSISDWRRVKSTPKRRRKDAA
jgi:hypothetical protein